MIRSSGGRFSSEVPPWRCCCSISQTIRAHGPRPAPLSPPDRPCPNHHARTLVFRRLCLPCHPERWGNLTATRRSDPFSGPLFDLPEAGSIGRDALRHAQGSGKPAPFPEDRTKRRCFSKQSGHRSEVAIPGLVFDLISSRSASTLRRVARSWDASSASGHDVPSFSDPLCRS
jgi:hypothetical protein